jgi:hypothetical protein
MSKSHVHFYESSPLNKANIPLDKFWNLPDDRRTGLLLLGLFLNETNWLLRLLAKASQSLREDATQPQLTPEEEAAEALVAMLITTLVGKIFEG